MKSTLVQFSLVQSRSAQVRSEPGLFQSNQGHIIHTILKKLAKVVTGNDASGNDIKKTHS
jgi:hypothetical protein